jgi:hypothetical protein
VNDTLSTPDPAAQVAEVRYIIEHRGDHSCESTLLAIRRVVLPPPGEPLNPSGGWPQLHSSDWTDTGSQAGYEPGTPWERHDDPEVNL